MNTNLRSKTIIQRALFIDETLNQNIYTIDSLKGNLVISFDNRSRIKHPNRFFPESQHSTRLLDFQVQNDMTAKKHKLNTYFVEEMPEMAKRWLFPWDDLTSHQSYNVTVRWKKEEE